MKTLPARSVREIEIEGKKQKRSGWREQNESQIGGEEKRNGRLAGAAETSKELPEWRRLQQKNLNILGLLKRKSGFSATEKAVGKNAAADFAKGNRGIGPEHQIVGRERVKVSESCILTRVREI